MLYIVTILLFLGVIEFDSFMHRIARRHRLVPNYYPRG